jgi:hypothetical protein
LVAATESVDSGRAAGVLDRWIAASATIQQVRD